MQPNINDERNDNPYPTDDNLQQSYRTPVSNEPLYYSESRDIPINMYSPGICVNQPYPRVRESDSAGSGQQRERAPGLFGFLRAMALVLACTFFSGAAAYFVMDFRFNRGDFPQPNHVVLGSNVIERPRDPGPSPTHTVAVGSEGITAEDIYDMARTQVVGIITEFTGMSGFSEGTAPISGSGFIISSDGYILTNYHVIEFAHRSEMPINVVLNDGTTYDAEVIGFEASSDVALIKIDAAGINPSIIGNSDNIRVGQQIYAIGNPFGDLVYTMTDGIVSALDRVVSVEGKSIRTFQLSAAVNRGNSGGPVYNADGEVIGIVTAKFVRGSVEGIGFAIPINDAIEIASELIEHGYISGRPLLGITGQTVSDANADYFDWVVGVFVRSVAEGSAAEAAGMLVGDIIIALNDEEVDSMEALRFALRDYKAGDTTVITVWRDGDNIDLTITFDEDLYAGQPGGRPVQTPDSPDPFENRP